MEDQKQSQPEEKKQSKLFLYLFLLMTLACGVFGWLYWMQKSETTEVTTENIQITQESEIVKRDLQQLQSDFESLKTDDEEIKQEIEEKKTLIEQLQKDAEKHKNDGWIIAKLKKETKTLREIMQHFVVSIDSLNQLNKQLMARNDSVSTELHTEKEKSASLLNEKEKLFRVGSVIKVSGVEAVAMNDRGKGKSDETQKARKTDKIRITFNLEENKIAPKGERTLYVRIVMPDGKEWCDSPDADHLFSFSGSKGFFALKKSIQYTNEDLKVELYVAKKEKQELPSGKYSIEVCMDHAIIGTNTLTLQ
jgi:DNA repair exonuclease SbcCD ATPase subunit